MTTAPIPGTNTVLIGHVPGITTAIGLALNEGEIGIFDPSERDNPISSPASCRTTGPG